MQKTNINNTMGMSDLRNNNTHSHLSQLTMRLLTAWHLYREATNIRASERELQNLSYR